MGRCALHEKGLLLCSVNERSKVVKFTELHATSAEITRSSPALFRNHGKITGNYVRTNQKYHSSGFLRSRLHRPETCFILHGHICAYVLQDAKIAYALSYSQRADVLLRRLVK